jgi:hypothetical protein
MLLCQWFGIELGFGLDLLIGTNMPCIGIETICNWFKYYRMDVLGIIVCIIYM